MTLPELDPAFLAKIAATKMPFGKYAGQSPDRVLELSTEIANRTLNFIFVDHNDLP